MLPLCSENQPGKALSDSRLPEEKQKHWHSRQQRVWAQPWEHRMATALQERDLWDGASQMPASLLHLRWIDSSKTVPPSACWEAEKHELIPILVSPDKLPCSCHLGVSLLKNINDNQTHKETQFPDQICPKMYFCHLHCGLFD